MANLKTAELKLWIYEGPILSYTGEPQYTITKNIIPNEKTILFEIGELVKDYVPLFFNGDFGISNLTAWASWEITNTFDNTPATTTKTTGTRLVTHGYGYFEDEINPQLLTPLQQSNTCVYWKKGEKVRIPLYQENELYSVEFYEGGLSVGSQSFGKTFTPLTTDTTSYRTDSTLIRTDATGIMGATSSNLIPNISAPVGTDKVVITTNDNKTVTLFIKYIEECKNTPYRVTFLNKFGSLQDIWFFGKRDESAKISREQYKVNTIQSTATTKFYPTYEPTDKTFNVNSKKDLTLNTGFICEDYNEVIQQLIQSENVWIHEDNKVFPVRPTDTSLTYKTKRYEKLLNFTVKFDYAYSEINLVR